MATLTFIVNKERTQNPEEDFESLSPLSCLQWDIGMKLIERDK
jgi:hypothetical protein